ncbi:protease modulator HflK N-terminal domain-containing protein, partial [Salmonella enterica]|uniref:protease modulator HflK N-terminal domain-containing protein n=1 Tax=Salmonella enterica TaxID=28901 RepID=UPI00398C46EE
MAWNQPGNHGPDTDPWGRSTPGSNPGGNGHTRGRAPGPPEPVDRFRKRSKKLGGFWAGTGTRSRRGSPPYRPMPQ